MVGIPEDLREGSGNPVLDAARLLRQRLELNRRFGWDVPIGAASQQREAAAELAAGDDSEKEAALEPIRAEVVDCTLCGLCEGRTNTVFGVGDALARLLFIGEGPGREEDLLGEPFVGRAGELLDKIIGAMGLKREQVYIANIVKCRPPENRNPTPEEMAACLPYLKRQIEVLQPDVICALGGVAAKALLSTDLSVGRLRGEFHNYAEIPVRVTYHPAYLLRSPHEKAKTWQDIKAVMEFLGLELPARGGRQ